MNNRKLDFFDGPSQTTVSIDVDDIRSIKRYSGNEHYTYILLTEGTFLLASKPDYETLKPIYDELKRNEKERK